MQCELSENLEKLKLESNGVKCYRSHFEFNPLQESIEVLKAWLEYRNIFDVAEKNIQSIALEEIQREGPPFSAFSNFQPEKVSLPFLQAWVSCFGISSHEKDKKWWIKTAQKLLNLQKKLIKKDNIIVTYTKLIALQKLNKIKNRFITQLNLEFNRWSQQDFTLVPFIPIIPPKEQEQSVIAKTMLAVALDASLLTVPLLMFSINDKIKKEIPNNNWQNKLIKEIPNIVIKSATIFTLEERKSRAVLKDLKDQNKIPFSISKILAQEYLQMNPKILTWIQGLVYPTLKSIFFA